MLFRSFALPLIARFLIEISTEEKEKLKEGSVLGSAAARSVVLLCKDYQSRVCVGYGDFCVKKLQVMIISSQLSTLSYHMTTVHPIISHHIILYYILSYHIMSYHIISCHVMSHIGGLFIGVLYFQVTELNSRILNSLPPTLIHKP